VLDLLLSSQQARWYIVLAVKLAWQLVNIEPCRVWQQRGFASWGPLKKLLRLNAEVYGALYTMQSYLDPSG
jgi:hypothetical protein